jgi:hypothetical protein
MRSNASSAEIWLPQDPCISRPSASSSFSYVSTFRYGARPVSTTDMKNSE